MRRMLAREVEAAIEAGQRAAALTERFDQPIALARALNAVGSAMWFTDPDKAPGPLERSIDVARAAGLDYAAAAAMGNLGSGAGEVRRYALAGRWLREAIAWCGARDLDFSGHYALAWLARTEFEQGRWAAADEAAATLLSKPSVNAIARMTALTVLGRLRARRGEPGPDAPLDEAAALAEPTGDLQRLWPVAAARAELAWLRGDDEAIGPLVAAPFELAGRLGHAWALGELGLWLRRGGVAVELPMPAAEPYALWLEGRWAAGAAAWRRIGCPYEAADALAGSPEEEDRREALTGFERLGARPAAARLARRLREAGATGLPRGPHPGTRANPAGLTARQLEVLTMVAGGLRNAEIAARLHLSPRTVDHHVSVVLAKLGVPTRQQAARKAAELGIAAQNR
jgi:DNA-binding CsgD family transcriptional regulator